MRFEHWTSYQMIQPTYVALSIIQGPFARQIQALQHDRGDVYCMLQWLLGRI